MTAKLAEKKGLIPPAPAELGGKNFSELLDSGKVEFKVDDKYPQAIGIANILARVASLGNCHWDVLINENEDSPFFTSDFPVGIEPTQNPQVSNRIVPFAPTIAILFQPDINYSRDSREFEFRNFSSKRRKVTHHEAASINRLLVRSAEDLVFFRDDRQWVVRFVERNRHFRIDGENIQIPSPRGLMQWSRQVVMPFQRG